MVTIAALFDSEADATNAMDRLMREDLEELDTKVVGSSSGTGDITGNVIFPVIPNTGAMTGPTGASGPIGITGGTSGADAWLDDFDEVERAFYHEGMREGATLALAKVHEEDVTQVRTLLSMFNARTYTAD